MINENGVYESALLKSIPGIECGFGTRLSPIPAPEVIWKNRPQWKQVHGKLCKEILCAEQKSLEVDGHFTALRNTPVPVLTADCVPILFAHKSGRLVAGVHAGWRGTIAKISENLFSTMAQTAGGKFLGRIAGNEIGEQGAGRGSVAQNTGSALAESVSGFSAKDWVAAIGPCIHACCYEVDVNLAEQFKNTFGSAVISKRDTGGPYLDLVLASQISLESIGIQEVDVIDRCTYCSKVGDKGSTPEFFSYRRDTHEKVQATDLTSLTHPPRRQWSAVWIDGG